MSGVRNDNIHHLQYKVMCPKDPDGMTYSVDSDQTAPSGEVWSVYSVCPDLCVRKRRIFTVSRSISFLMHTFWVWTKMSDHIWLFLDAIEVNSQKKKDPSNYLLCMWYRWRPKYIKFWDSEFCHPRGSNFSSPSNQIAIPSYSVSLMSFSAVNCWETDLP